MTTITRTGVDQVLERAVADGAVPQVVAIAADRDGIIYEGGAGPRVAGEAGTVTADTHFRIMSMTKMVATTVAVKLVEQGKLDLDAPVERYCRSSPRSRFSTDSTAMSHACARRQPRRRSSTS